MELFFKVIIIISFAGNFLASKKNLIWGYSSIGTIFSFLIMTGEYSINSVEFKWTFVFAGAIIGALVGLLVQLKESD